MIKIYECVGDLFELSNGNQATKSDLAKSGLFICDICISFDSLQENTHMIFVKLFGRFDEILSRYRQLMSVIIYFCHQIE